MRGSCDPVLPLSCSYPPFSWARLGLGLGLGLSFSSACGEQSDGGPGWQVLAEERAGALLGVWGTAADHVVVVGSDPGDGQGPYALRYDGEAWHRLQTGASGTLWWVHTDGQTAYFAGTSGTVVRHDVATAVSELLTTPTTATLYGVYAFAADDVWAVGGTPEDGTGVILRYDGTVFTEVTPTEGDGLVFFKVWGRAPDDVWIVGDGGASLHFDGEGFSRVEVPLGRNLFTVHGAGSLTVAVGGTESAHVVELEEGVWTNATPAGVAPQLNGVFAHDGGTAVAVGSDCAVWERGDGGWQVDESAPPGRESLHSVYVDPAGDVWAVGGQILVEPFGSGKIIHRGNAVVEVEFP